MSRLPPLLALILLLVIVQTAGLGSGGPKALDVSRADADAAIAAAGTAGQQAFLKIRAADQEGGNVTTLATRFNEALELLTKARAFMDEGLPDRAVTSAEGAQGIFEAVGGEAGVLTMQAVADASTRRTAVLLAAPIAVILTTVISYFLIRIWQTRRIEQTMEMEIKEGETS